MMTPRIPLEHSGTITVNLQLPSLDQSALMNLLASINSKLDMIIGQEKQLMKEMDDLSTQVAQNNTVEESAVVLIKGLAAQITAAGTDPVKLAALTTSLKTSADDLAAAVAANTPAAPPAPPA